MCQSRTSFIALTMSLLTLGSLPTRAQSPTRPLRPDEYGTIIMNNASEEAGFEPALFEHCRHRALYTCRLCHVDLGFAMIANGTGVAEQDNRDGFFCGACHDGKEAFGYAPEDTMTEGTSCARCHTSGREYRKQFMEFQQTLSRGPWVLPREARRLERLRALPPDHLRGSTRRGRLFDAGHLRRSLLRCLPREGGLPEQRLPALPHQGRLGIPSQSPPELE